MQRTANGLPQTSCRTPSAKPRRPRRPRGTPPGRKQRPPRRAGSPQTPCRTLAATPRRPCCGRGSPVEMRRCREFQLGFELPGHGVSVHQKPAHCCQWAGLRLQRECLMPCSIRSTHQTVPPAAGVSLIAPAAKLRAAASGARRSRARSAGRPPRSRRSPPGDARTA
jgi:hypothetical protein